MKPADEKQLAEGVRTSDVPFEVVGLGTKRKLGNATAGVKLDLSNFDKIINYEPDELIIECGAAAKISAIETLLSKSKQMLAFEPPNFSAIFNADHAGSIGGALACNLAGPRRLKAGAPRDHILGVTGVNGQGELIKSGARVVKNVTGYDVPRLMAGSYGTLMAFTSVIFKTLPKPETEQTCVLADLGPARAVEDMATLLATGAEISAAAYVPREGTYLRLEGIATSVQARLEMVHSAIAVKDILDEKASLKNWQGLRDVRPLQGENDCDVWRVVVAPSEAAAYLAALPLTHRYFLDWAGSLVWLVVEAGSDVRKYLNRGVATKFRSRQQSDVFQPQPKHVAALSARVKAAFDPRGLFNPGKMYMEF